MKPRKPKVLNNWPRFREELGQVNWAEYFDEFVKGCERRIKKGAKLYGDSYKHQKNLEELLEEALDIAVYSYLEIEKQGYKPDSKEYQGLAMGALIGFRAYNYFRYLIDGQWESLNKLK